MMKIRVLTGFVFLLASFAGSCAVASPRGIAATDSVWVDSVFHTLTPDQRIAQLMIIRAFSDRDSVYNDSLTGLIKRFDPGGVCFFKGTPFRQANLTNLWQHTAQTPLLIATDAENGLGMRLDSAVAFPRQMTLGAMTEDSLVARVATVIARDCRRMGIQMNFAPVADINNNPDNPVIGARSFGEDRELVARRSVIIMKGLQKGGIISTAKHFPGHGDTDSDSHLTLPVIRHPENRLDSLELYPFKELIRNGVEGIMVAHLFVPALDSANNEPATLSQKIVTGFLRERLGFRGFIITDALDMKGVTKYYKPGEIEVKALLAGNDILLLPQNIEKAVNAIRLAGDSSQVIRDLVDRKCRNILNIKYRAGLDHPEPVLLDHLYEDLNPLSSTLLTRDIFRASITLVKNENHLLPVTFLDRRKIAVLFIGDTTEQPFQQVISRYAVTTSYNLPANFSPARRDSTVALLSSNDLILVGLHCNQAFTSRQYGIHDCTLDLIDTLSASKKVVLDILGSPYVLSYFKNAGKMEAIVASYQDCPESQALSAGLIFGGIPFLGHLPVTPVPAFPSGTGTETQVTRLVTMLPEEMGIPSEKLKIIDSIALSGITGHAYPGCQVLFAKDGKVFYEKSFGHPTYDDTLKVTNESVYDLASVTKVVATTLAIMKLFEEGKLSPDEKLGTYLPELRGSNKENLVLRDVMTHQAGLQAWIPFYIRTLKNGQPDTLIYKHQPSIEFPSRVASGLYIRRDIPDTIYREIRDAPLRATRDYKYSDMGFYLLRKIIERLSGKPLETYVDESFYRPLGLSTMGFKPLERFPAGRIMPTEDDTVFRKQVLRGDVHDPGAAMLGGVSGHAGLFSDAHDLAVLLQLLLNEGAYGGKQYFLPSTIREFTRVQFPKNGNRRALGFDKPVFNYTPDGPSCKSASPRSFGHSGFTGTYIWADPENNLVYVFLSNRVYPDAANEKLLQTNIRTRIHQAMYDLLEDKKLEK